MTPALPFWNETGNLTVGKTEIDTGNQPQGVVLDRSTPLDAIFKSEPIQAG